MSCAICLESYLEVDETKKSSGEKLPFKLLEGPQAAATVTVTTTTPTPATQPHPPFFFEYVPEHMIIRQGRQRPSRFCCLPFFGRRRRQRGRPDSSKTEKTPLGSEDKPVATKCGHIFHEGCIRKWVTDTDNTNNECPICRSGICLKNLVRLHIDGEMTVKQDTPVGVLVSMSFRQFEILKTGFATGFKKGMEQFKEECETKVQALEEEVRNLKISSGLKDYYHAKEVEGHLRRHLEELKVLEESFEDLRQIRQSESEKCLKLRLHLQRPAPGSSKK